MKVPRLPLAISSREKIAGAREIGRSSEPLRRSLNYNNQLQSLLCKQIVCYSATDLERVDVLLDERCFPRKRGQVVPIPLTSCEGKRGKCSCLTKTELNSWF